MELDKLKNQHNEINRNILEETERAWKAEVSGWLLTCKAVEGGLPEVLDDRLIDDRLCEIRSS